MRSSTARVLGALAAAALVTGGAGSTAAASAATQGASFWLGGDGRADNAMSVIKGSTVTASFVNDNNSVLRVDAEPDHRNGPFGSIEIQSSGLLTTGTFSIHDENYFITYVGNGPEHPADGYVRVTDFAAGYRSNGIPYVKRVALSYVFYADTHTPPTYGSLGYNTTAPAVVPGRTATAGRADFNGDGITDIAVYRPSTGQWFVRGKAPVTWGLKGDVPVPGDYNGDGRSDIAVYRPSTGQWFVRGKTPVKWGVKGDVPVADDYNGDGVTDLAVWRPSTGTWFVRGVATDGTGDKGDVPVPDVYLNDGGALCTFWRPSDGLWYNHALGGIRSYGVRGDIPVQGDYDGDGDTDVAVYRPSTQQWFTGSSPVGYGIAGDIPVPGTFSAPGSHSQATRRAVFRPSTSTWYIDRADGHLSVQYGVRGDVPV